MTPDAPAPASVPSVEAPTVEHHLETLGIGEPRPRLSWRVTTGSTDWTQERYQLRVTRLTGAVEETTRTTSWTVSDEQLLVAWPFAPLESRSHVSVQVRVAGRDGAESAWSEPTVLETGLLTPQDWRARLITPDPPGLTDTPAPLLRREFTVRAGLRAARLYITAHGLYEAGVNGSRVGDHLFAPGWTSYRHRLRYQTHDVTALLRPGVNVIGAMLGNGWYRGRLGLTGERAQYGERRALLAQLELRYDDGTEEEVLTDEHWTWAPGHVLSDDLYDGTYTDLTAEKPGWNTPGHEGPGWARVSVLGSERSVLTAPDGPPVRRTALVSTVTRTVSPSGTVVDFGQNLVGWVRLRVRGEPGTLVTVRHAEVLQDGALAVRPLRTARATDTYRLAASGEVVLEPRFTFHGFRYAEIAGVPDLDLIDAEAVVVGSDLRRTGWFHCSNPLLERLHENVVWGMRGNFLDVPTDCPQRDERLGWTGDIQVFAPTAAFLFDVAGFLTSWLADLSADQYPDGTVPWIVPDVMPSPTPPTAAWSDAAVIVPWVLHERYGDSGVLARQFPSMCAWTDRAAELAPEGLWSGGVQFGDWLDPAAPPEDPSASTTHPDLVATAYLARSAELTARAAAVLGQELAEHRYTALAQRVRKAFADEFVTPAGRVLGDSQTAYALALRFALLPQEAQRRRAARRLADLVRAAGFRIATGFVGTPLVLDALAEAGESALAHRLLGQRQSPSWLHPVTLGATTVWERWDSLLPDGTVNPGEMTSFNHYALGAVADWMHRTVAGLAPGAPGYRKLEIRPVPGGGLTSASARHLTPYGEASVAWRLEGETFRLSIVVPPGCTATVRLPDGSGPYRVGSGRREWRVTVPTTASEPLSTASGVRPLMDDQPAWERISRLLATARPDAFPDDTALAAIASVHLDGSIAELLSGPHLTEHAPIGDNLHQALLTALIEG